MTRHEAIKIFKSHLEENLVTRGWKIREGLVSPNEFFVWGLRYNDVIVAIETAQELGFGYNPLPDGRSLRVYTR